MLEEGVEVVSKVAWGSEGLEEGHSEVDGDKNNRHVSRSTPKISGFETKPRGQGASAQKRTCPALLRLWTSLLAPRNRGGAMWTMGGLGEVCRGL